MSSKNISIFELDREQHLGMNSFRRGGMSEKQKLQKAKNPAVLGFLSASRHFKFKSLAVSYSHMANATLPSALQRFTSVFGMDTGGSTALLPPGIFGSLES